MEIEVAQEDIDQARHLRKKYPTYAPTNENCPIACAARRKFGGTPLITYIGALIDGKQYQIVPGPTGAAMEYYDKCCKMKPFTAQFTERHLSA